MWNVVYILNQTGKRCSPIVKGGLEIVLGRQCFKIDDSKREILRRLKDLIQQNYDSTELEDSLQAVDDTSTSFVEADEEVDDDSQEIVIVIDSEDEGWKCSWRETL